MIRPTHIYATGRMLGRFAKEMSQKQVEDLGWSEEDLESVRRTAIGRAYYAVFHQAKETALELGCGASASGRISHKSLWDWYSGKKRSLGTRGLAIHEHRKRADYDLTASMGPKSAQALDGAQELLDAIAVFRREQLGLPNPDTLPFEESN